MTRYLVDTSAIIQVFVSEPHTANARAMVSGLSDGDELILPEFCLLECVNVLWKHVRFHGISESEAETLVAELEALNVVIAPITGLLSRALTIGLKHRLAIYDSVYIALAEQLDYPLVTDDIKQAAAAQAEGIALKPLTDFTPA